MSICRNPEGRGCRKYTDELVASVVNDHLEKGYGAKRLSKIYGIPHPTINHWFAGDYRRLE